MKIRTLDDLIVNLQKLQEIHGNLLLQKEIELQCVFECQIEKLYVSHPKKRLGHYPQSYICKTIGALERRIEKEKKLSLKSALEKYNYDELDKSYMKEDKELFKSLKAQNIKSLQKPVRCLKTKLTINNE